jgi:hypothetical protein
MTGRHAGPGTSRPATAYTGRHETPPAAGCAAFSHVHGSDGESTGLLVCDRPDHPGDTQHYDEADGILWSLIETRQPAEPVPAGAVA